MFETEFVYFKVDSWPGILSTNQSKQQFLKHGRAQALAPGGRRTLEGGQARAIPSCGRQGTLGDWGAKLSAARHPGHLTRPGRAGTQRPAGAALPSGRAGRSPYPPRHVPAPLPRSPMRAQEVEIGRSAGQLRAGAGAAGGRRPGCVASLWKAGRGGAGRPAGSHVKKSVRYIWAPERGIAPGKPFLSGTTAETAAWRERACPHQPPPKEERGQE